MSDILKTSICSIPGIKTAKVIKSKKSYIDKSIKTKTIYTIHTNGSNINSVLDVPQLDPSRCQTDSIKEIEELYGIDTAQDKLRTEIEKVITGINPSHYSVLCDEMCLTGTVTGINKTGTKQRDSSNVLLRAFT